MRATTLFFNLKNTIFFGFSMIFFFIDNPYRLISFQPHNYRAFFVIQKTDPDKAAGVSVFFMNLQHGKLPRRVAFAKISAVKEIKVKSFQ